MKKLFSLLTLALLTMSAWAQTTVSFDFGSNAGYENAQAVASVTQSNVTITFDKGSGSTTPAWYTSGAALRVYAGGTITVSAATGYQVIGVTYTFGSGDNNNEITCNKGTYVEPTWTGAATEVVFTVGGTSKHRRIAGMDVTIEEVEVPAFPLPVFTPDSKTFTETSLAVTVSSEVEDANIYLYDVIDGEIDFTTGRFFHQSGEFYVTETSSYAAYAYKGNESSDYAYATYTKVKPTCATPTFTPATGTTFEDDLAIRIDCETEGATVMYQVNDGDIEMDEAPIYLTLTETSTVTAMATKDGYDDSPEATATYTKVPPATGTCIVFNYEDDEPITEATEYTVTRPGAYFTVSSGMINGHYRIYKNQTITFTSQAGNITRIEFDGVSGNPVSNFGEVEGMTYSNPNGLWIGSAESVTFTATVAQVRCTEIRVYVDGEIPVITVAAPTLPEACEFEESKTIEITNNENGAIVKYTTDDENWTTYEEPFTITETTTVKAKAVKDEVESVVVSATYTKVEPAPEITTLAQVNALAKNTEFTFNGNAVVTAQSGSYLWLRDESGYGLIYGAINNGENPTFASGTVLNQGWTATTDNYNGLIEYKLSNNVAASGNTNAELAAVQEITTLEGKEDMVNAYVQVKNIVGFTVSNKNITATLSDGSTMAMYNALNLEVPTDASLEKPYTVDGAIALYVKNNDSTLQVYPINFEGFVPQTNDVNSIAEAYNLNQNSTFTMYDDVVVTYHDTTGKRLFIRDTHDNSGMIYGALEGEPTFNNGDVLSDGWTATFTVYQNTPEFTNAEGIAASGETREANPFERNAEELAIENIHEYIVLKGQTVLPDNSGNNNSDKRFYIDLPNDSLVLYNQFGVELPTIEEGKTYDVNGIVTVYRGKVQVYITEMTEVQETEVIRGDVNGDKLVNLTDVTTLISLLLNNGEMPAGADTNLDTLVNIGDVTTLIRYLLNDAWPE